MFVPLLYSAAAVMALALLLLLHHGIAHMHDPPDSLTKRESCWQVCYFQPSDVGNVKTCNHEMWILACAFVSIFLIDTAFSL